MDSTNTFNTHTYSDPKILEVKTAEKHFFKFFRIALQEDLVLKAII